MVFDFLEPKDKMLTKNERSKYLKELCSSCVRTGETIWDKPRERKKKKKVQPWACERINHRWRKTEPKSMTSGPPTSIGPQVMLADGIVEISPGLL